MGIRKDLKKYIKRLNDKNYTWLYADGVVKNLEEILREDKERKTKRKKKVERNEYIAVKQSDFKDDGDTFEAIKDGYGLPPMGCKFVKVRK
jgi:hypothetical protein